MEHAGNGFSLGSRRSAHGAVIGIFLLLSDGRWRERVHRDHMSASSRHRYIRRVVVK